MGLFSTIKDNMSNAYQVIYRESGTEDYPIWCHPSEDFRNGTILDVGPEDTALLYSTGSIVASFSGGRYTLSTSNYPFLDNLRSSFSGGEKSYKYRVFFIDTKEITNLKWGSASPIDAHFTINNPVYDALKRANGVVPNNVPSVWDVNLPLQMRGNYSLKIDEPKLFLQKYGGTSTIQRTKEQLDRDVFGPRLIEGITDRITDAVAMIENGMEIQRHKGKISEKLLEDLNAIFKPWGVLLTDFRIEAIKIKEDDPEWLKIREAYMSVASNQMNMSGIAMGEVAGVGIQGNDWQRIQARNIMQDMVNNPGAGGVAAAGAGIGMGIAAGGAMGDMASAMLSQPQESSQKTCNVKCPNCGELVANGKFCQNCGAALPQNKFCTNCGKEVTPGSKFCSNCGNKVE